MKYTYFYDTIAGNILISEEDGFITNLDFVERVNNKNFNIKETDLIKEAKKQLDEYFKKERREFELPIKAVGTEFQQNVWKALLTIPYGKTVCYGDIAEQIGNPKASRAVGLANNRNPISIIVPCHRVIGKNGKLVGYGGGVHVKDMLLKLEK